VSCKCSHCIKFVQKKWGYFQWMTTKSLYITWFCKRGLTLSIPIHFTSLTEKKKLMTYIMAEFSKIRNDGREKFSSYSLICTYRTTRPCIPFKSLHIHWREENKSGQHPENALLLGYHTWITLGSVRILRIQQSCTEDEQHTTSRPHINYPAANITHL